MRSVRPCLVPLALLALLSMPRPTPADYELASADLFSVRYASAFGEPLSFDASQAVAFELLPHPDGGVVGRWTLPVPGTEAQVCVRCTPVDATTSRWRLGVVHPRGLPAGWRLEHAELRFPLRQTGAGLAAQDVFRIARVYGPTAYPANTPSCAVDELYPTFVQTQQITVLNPIDAIAAAVAVEDTRGHRKRLGFRLDPSRELRILTVTHIPENLGNAASFFPPYTVLLRTGIAGGLEGAIRWYRQVQRNLSDSFLNRRRAAGVHPYLRRAKFIVFGGAERTRRPFGHRHDVTDEYVEDLLDTFGSIHGPGLMVYLIGWQDDTGVRRSLWPDMFDRILPGYANLVAAARSRGFPVIPYFWPGVMSTRSAFFDPTLLRLDRAGLPVMDEVDGEPVGCVSMYSPAPERVYGPLLLETIMTALGFDGAYLDACSPWAFCYRPDNPPNENEQLLGIQRWLGSVRERLRERNRIGLFSCETPSEVMPADLSGLDISDAGRRGLNLFRRTYPGQEWPTTHLVVAKHPLVYALSLVRGLVEGARPTISWPECDGVIPRPAASSPAYRSFFAMLRQYCERFEDGFDTVIDGALGAAIPSFHTTMVPPLTFYPEAWTRPMPAVLHGVFAPDVGSSERVILLARWTTPDDDALRGLNLAADHPLRQAVETVELSLSRRNLDLGDDELEYEVVLLDAKTGIRRRIGRLPHGRTAELHVVTDMEPASFQFLEVTPVR